MQTALVCFLAYSLSGHTITPDVAFVSISLLNLLSAPIIIIPMAVMNLVQGMVSMKRVNDFLLKEEINTEDVQHDPTVRECVRACVRVCVRVCVCVEMCVRVCACTGA